MLLQSAWAGIYCGLVWALSGLHIPDKPAEVKLPWKSCIFTGYWLQLQMNI